MSSEDQEPKFQLPVDEPLQQRPGADVVQSFEPIFPYTAEEVTRTSQIYSEAYKVTALKPYQTRDQSDYYSNDKRSQESERRRGDNTTRLGMLSMVQIRNKKPDVAYGSLNEDNEVKFGWKVKKKW
ncbi:hypothetical protein NX059_005909 [Plenodomus lindquistii]|nr:hypothetical protein NX059_005909 [Plenodomus lindquistii]